MRAIDKNGAPVQKAARLHLEEVKKRILSEKPMLQEEIYQNIAALKTVRETANIYSSFQDILQEDDWHWLENFILADVPMLLKMAHQDNLAFNYFHGLYTASFARGAEKYLNKDSAYNAYTLVKELNIKVCPYCDQSYITTVIKQEGKLVRTGDLDHFFPKNEFPLLAMCFFNLIPVCKSCNYLKKESLLGISPYEENIEKQTFLFPDLPVGVSVGKLTDDDCAVHLHPTRKMRDNDIVLGLESRYAEHGDIAYELIKKGQLYDKAKMKELADNYPQLFKDFEDVKRVLFGMPLEVNGKRPFQKLYRDVLKTLGI